MSFGYIDYDTYEQQLTLFNTKDSSDTLATTSESDATVKTISYSSNPPDTLMLEEAQSADSDYALSEAWLTTSVVEPNESTLVVTASNYQEDEVAKAEQTLTAQTEVVDGSEFEYKTTEASAFPGESVSDTDILSEIDRGIKAAQLRLGIANLRPATMLVLGLVAYHIIFRGK